MRSWLIGANVLLAGVLMVMLVTMPLMDRGRMASATPAASQPFEVSEQPAEPEETPQKKTADFARSLAVQTLLAMKASARDPSSVRFRDVFTVNLGNDTERLILVCGQVTGRNGFGGYTGYVPFVASSETDIKVAGMAGFEGFYGDCIRGKPIAPVYL